MLDDADLQAWQVSAADFELVAMVADPAQNGYTTTADDPQMLWINTGGQAIRTVSYYADFLHGEPREMCLYYTTRSDEPYSQDRRVFPYTDTDGRYVYVLPRGNVVGVRLDPCNPDLNTTVTVVFDQDGIDFNHGDTLPKGIAYFIPSWYQLFCLILYPALAAAALDWLRAALQLLRKRSWPLANK